MAFISSTSTKLLSDHPKSLSCPVVIAFGATGGLYYVKLILRGAEGY